MLFSGREKRPKPQPGITTRAPVEIETVFGPNTSMQGDLRSSGGVRVDGDFSGTIEIAGNLVIGEQAQVVATISAHNVQVQGTVQGDVTAKRLEILEAPWPASTTTCDREFDTDVGGCLPRRFGIPERFSPASLPSCVTTHESHTHTRCCNRAVDPTLYSSGYLRQPVQACGSLCAPPYSRSGTWSGIGSSEEALSHLATWTIRN